MVASTRGRHVDVSVVTSGHDVADARLHRVVAALLDAGLTVEVLGLGDPGDAPVGALARTWSRGGMLARAVRAAALPWRGHGQVLLSLDPDSALGCAVAARALRRRWVADVHEDYPALLEDRAWARGVRGGAAGVLANAATRVVGRADLTAVADDHVPPLDGQARRRIVVRNLPDLSVVRSGSESGSAPAAGDPLRAVYVGDGRRSRGLEPMLEAVAAAPGWELDLVGPLHAPDDEWARRRVARDDLRGRVRLHGRLPPQTSWRVAAGASVGFALLDDTPAFRAAVPTKVYEYLAAGLAVLATPLPRVADLVAGSGAGAVAGTSGEAAAVLREWGEQPARLERARERAREWAEEHLTGPSPYAALAREVAALLDLRPL